MFIKDDLAKTIMTGSIIAVLSSVPSCFAQDNGGEQDAEELMRQSQMSVQDLVGAGVIPNSGSSDQSPYAPDPEQQKRDAAAGQGYHPSASPPANARRSGYMPPLRPGEQGAAASGGPGVPGIQGSPGGAAAQPEAPPVFAGPLNFEPRSPFETQGPAPQSAPVAPSPFEVQPGGPASSAAAGLDSSQPATPQPLQPQQAGTPVPASSGPAQSITDGY